jgi:hypothetical protein
VTYLVWVNTKDSPNAIIVAFPNQTAADAFEARVAKLTGDNDQPFGFRAEFGTAARILGPDEALSLIPTEKLTT